MSVQSATDNSRGFCMRLYEAAKALRAAGMRVSVQGEDVQLDGVGTDTRSLQKGALFIALSGPNFDGNSFAEQALQSEAAACLLERDMGVSPALIVDDSRRALGLLAQAWRRRFNLPLVAITGSNGKTTVKEMLASIFAQQGRVLATHGNLNNDIGMPLTLLRLDRSYDYAVVEMGANHAGEIAYLSQLAAPDVALITNTAIAHIAGFGSLEGVAQAKGEIYAGLAAGGCAVINADDAFAPLWRKIIVNTTQAPRCLGFAITANAEVQASWPAVDGRVKINTPEGGFDLRLSLPGRHNLMNALAATAAALGVGLDIAAIRAGLESMQAVPGRLQLKAGIKGSRILDDTYNANPASMKAALAVLQDFSGRHFLALGDMGELGEDEKALHAQTGEQAHASGVQRLYSLGSLSHLAAAAFGDEAQSFDSHRGMIDRLREDLAADVTLLVKGSRRMQMDRIVDALSVDGEGC
ncbi:UDP-N-acetylmuramoyl-tripeptide--D-alanyl-D-alanine ligase [hydrothermal vent metagenome]|uniref:UDP-MurNAc-pentapeptide synthetase n=1 Tax=hydrothermal vent metagenome TaxID=652676 RepID=A0A3B1BKJ1_9ZZZZ